MPNKYTITILLFITGLFISITRAYNFPNENQPNYFIEYQADEPDINLNISFYANMNKEDYSGTDVKGVQFDIIYDSDKLIFNEIVSLVNETVFEYIEVKPGQLKCVMFRLDGSSITDSELSSLASLSFAQPDNFYGDGMVYIENIIVAGKYGEDISPYFTSNFWKINFINLKPIYTEIYIPDNNIFSDSINISFQLHRDSNVQIDLYNMFGEKVESVMNKYMDLGVYFFSIDNYNELDEELDSGEHKVKFSVNNECLDSIYVIYKELGNEK